MPGRRPYHDGVSAIPPTKIANRKAAMSASLRTLLPSALPAHASRIGFARRWPAVQVVRGVAVRAMRHVAGLRQVHLVDLGPAVEIQAVTGHVRLVRIFVDHLIR